MNEKVYRDLLPELKSYLYRITCDQEVSNDLAQDSFLKAIEKEEQFKGRSGLKTWIFSIATNLAMDWLRKRKRWSENAQDEAKKLAQSDPNYGPTFLNINKNSAFGAFEFKEHINFCFTCIAKTLPIEQQVVLILKDIYDFKISEISLILDSREGTIKHWLFSARKAMCDIFDRRCALINKKGACYQCSELNGFFNPKQIHKDILFPRSEDQQKLYNLRTKLIKAINPISSIGSELEDSIMQVLRKAIGDD
jgi:RNA polymerase sigma-70 factor (ECF subfamily)